MAIIVWRWKGTSGVGADVKILEFLVIICTTSPLEYPIALAEPRTSTFVLE